MATSGTYTSALASGGENGGYTGVVEEWNGTSWTETTDLNTTRGESGGAGASSESALVFAGKSPVNVFDNTESWNGSSWTEVADVNTARFQVASGMGRVYTNALCVAGYTPDGVSVNNTESWNGSSWTEVNNLNVARRGGGSQTGTNTSALFLGGLTNPPPVYT